MILYKYKILFKHWHMILFIIFFIFSIIWFFLFLDFYYKIISDNYKEKSFSMFFFISILLIYIAIFIYSYYFSSDIISISTIINDLKNFQINSDINSDKENTNNFISNLSNYEIIKYYLFHWFMEEIMKLIVWIILYFIIIKYKDERYNNFIILIFALIISSFAFQIIENFLYLINGWLTTFWLIFRHINLIHFITPLILIIIYVSNKTISLKYGAISLWLWTILHTSFNVFATLNFNWLVLFLVIALILLFFMFYNEILSELE